MQQRRQRACGVGPAAESEHEDAVTRAPVLHQVAVAAGDLAVQAGAEGQARDLGELLAEAGEQPRLGQGADARVVVDELPLRVAHERLHEAHDVGVFTAEFIARAVEADDQVARCRQGSVLGHGVVGHGLGAQWREPRLCLPGAAQARSLDR